MAVYDSGGHEPTFIQRIDTVTLVDTVTTAVSCPSYCASWMWWCNRRLLNDCTDTSYTSLSIDVQGISSIQHVHDSTKFIGTFITVDSTAAAGGVVAFTLDTSS